MLFSDDSDVIRLLSPIFERAIKAGRNGY